MEVLAKYFESNRYFLTKHHLDSFDDFVTNKLPSNIKALNPIKVLKNQENGVITHDIEVYVGGVDGSLLQIRQPHVMENGKRRMLLPNEARLKDLTYAVDLFADVMVRYMTHNSTTNKQSVEEVMMKDVKIGSIPVMLHSKLCYLGGKSKEKLHVMGECIKDVGGYFIIDGKEKVIVAQERIATNRIFINKYNDDKYSHSGMIRCTSRENPLFPKTITFYIIRDDLRRDTPPDLRKSIVISLPGFKDHVIPLFVLFRAFGIESDKHILEHIVGDDINNKSFLDFLYFSVVSAKDVMTQEDALKFLANRVEFQSMEKVHHILLNDVFPNMGNSYSDKAMFLGHIVGKLVRVAVGAEKESDRDNYLYKRVDISGFLMGNLFRDYYNQFRNVIRNRIDNQYLYGPWRSSLEIKNLINKTNFFKIFDSSIVTMGLIKSMKGSWGRSMIDAKMDPERVKEGIVQDLNRISYMSYTSHLRRVNTPIDPTAKVVAPHRLHLTQWGVMCPAESPDGASIGLSKNFAIMCHITFDIPIDQIQTALGDLGVMPLYAGNHQGKAKIMINSNWIGIHNDPVKLYTSLKHRKRIGKLNPYTSISWDVFKNEINILTEAGRCTRPLFVVKAGKLVYDHDRHKKLSWDELIQTGIIEFMDVEEIGYAYVAMMPRDISKYHTHCELHPSTIFSVVTHNIPLPNHNQAPRNVFFGAQGKQAIGVYATNFNNRIDTMSYVLHYPQRSIVATKYMDYIGNNELPAGANLMVAIASYTGYNQEDSIIINKSAIERGCFNLTYLKSIIETVEVNPKDGTETVFANPVKMTQDGVPLQSIKYAKYDKLDDNGLPKVNSYISEGDAIVGKTFVQKTVETTEEDNLFGSQNVREAYYDKSLIADKTVSGMIDKVVVYDTPGKVGAKTCKIRMRKIRIPELGDKMASRSGQKGVVGFILPAEDMPFNKQGIVPDIIINPHALPSRMTIAHLLECLLCKVAVNVGCTVDATPFNDYNYDEFTNLLQTKFGLEKYGNEILYNGFNGVQIETEIFFGPTYYMRLKHMVSDKINYRSSGGPITIKTRQPTKGRSAGGALRIGEMEVHCTWAHGMMHFLNESMMERSDKYVMPIDNDTKGLVISQHTSDNVSKIRTPFSFKLLTQEIAALGVKMDIMTDSPYAEGIDDEDDIYEDSCDLSEE
jgi:DNA-directed RNA polymerase II subunit RPB2